MNAHFMGGGVKGIPTHIFLFVVTVPRKQPHSVWYIMDGLIVVSTPSCHRPVFPVQHVKTILLLVYPC